MNVYSNELYRDLIVSILGDSFYSNNSYDSKIASMRRYAEIVLRRLLGDHPVEGYLTIGNSNIRNSLIEKGYTESILYDALKGIRGENSRCHSNNVVVATEEDYKKTLDYLTELYVYLFYKFFKQYSFGSNTRILEVFSLLPPIIRFRTLEHLFDEDNSNIVVIDKYVLARYKVFGYEKTLEWIDDKKELLSSLQSVDDGVKAMIRNTFGFNAESIIQSLETNMYVQMNEKIESLKKVIGKPLYEDFETAISYYRKFGKLDCNTDDEIEFNDLMEFVYIGRRSIDEQLGNIEIYLLDRC